MADLLPPRYAYEARLQGLDDATIQNAIAGYRRFDATGAAPILSLAHLAHATGASYRYLRRVAGRRTNPYTPLELPKQSGAARRIHAPEPMLRDVQRWILDNCLSALDRHPASFAYHTKKSIVDCAQQHAESTWLLKLDLHDFFHSVTEKQVYRVFRSLGYAPLVSLELARICTISEGYEPLHRQSNPRYPVIHAYASNNLGVLAQGAPTSGALANAATRALDNRLQLLADRSEAVYSRYSDDLVFSGGSFDRAKVTDILRRATSIIEREGFAVHHRKTRIIPPGARRIVLGLLLTEGTVRLSPWFRRQLEVHIHGAGKFGLAHHARHRKWKSVISFVNHVEGRLAFAQSVDPAYTLRVRERWNTVLAQNQLPVPTLQRDCDKGNS